MTFKKGTLWKTSWNRGRGTPPTSIVGQMAFFSDFQTDDLSIYSEYRTAAPPGLGAVSPYWFAAVGTGGFGGFFGSFPAYTATVRGNNTTGLVDVDGRVISSAGDYMASLLNQGPDSVSAVLVTVQVVATDVQVQVYFADQIYQFIADAGSFSPPSVPLLLYPGGSTGRIHGACGGDVMPTADEVAQWFADLKANLEITAIPGKTTHLYSAASVFPAVPVTLPNDQNPGTDDMTYTVTSGVPTPANTLINVRFPW